MKNKKDNYFQEQLGLFDDDGNLITIKSHKRKSKKGQYIRGLKTLSLK